MDYRSILCLDIGSGTQDALLYLPGREIENCPKFVLPTPARMVAERLGELARDGRGVFLHGTNMGGGFYRALMAHLKAGGRAAATPQAALALADDVTTLTGLGVELGASCPEGYVPVHLSDFEPAFWRSLLSLAGLPYPDLVLAAAQDHGFHPGASNRLGRFSLWREFLASGGDPATLLFKDVPPVFTRLATLQEAIGGGRVADTGAAAALGAMADPAIADLSSRTGVTLVNVGNSHILGFLLYRGRMLGVYEHHTSMLDADGLWRDLEAFRAGRLLNEQVLNAGGHGTHVSELPATAGDFSPTFVLGPRRALLKDHQVSFPAPGGDMMLTGAIGLLKGLSLALDWREGPFSG